MTAISRLHVRAVRNIVDASIDPKAGFNLLYGSNGSGKTSILEAIHSLASGKSFRSGKLDLLVQHGSDKTLVFAELASGHKFGFSKSLKEPPQLKLDGDRVKNWESVALLLPLLVLDSNTFRLADGGPQVRRAFLDWGVFHVEPGFLANWRDVKRCIAQRNLLLRGRVFDSDQISAWDAHFARCSDYVDMSRKKYISLFFPLFTKIYSSLAPSLSEKLSFSYARGWDEGKHLEEVLVENQTLDFKYGATQAGPHRAEILLKFGKEKANDVLSRGQLKLLVIAMKIAQGELLNTLSSRRCSFLVDDLAAELDSTNRSKVLELLHAMQGQVFITAVERADIDTCLPDSASPTTFHVERGIITT
ncbi:MAG: DNA replication and repair protein RecF [Glaciecola sp.]|jgi:DNA replication and repair protein RecF